MHICCRKICSALRGTNLLWIITLKLNIQYSWVTALQNLYLYREATGQGAVNPFGTNAIAAFNSVTRIDSFVFAFGESYSASVATYSAQNKGAGKMGRITEG